MTLASRIAVGPKLIFLEKWSSAKSKFNSFLLDCCIKGPYYYVNRDAIKRLAQSDIMMQNLKTELHDDNEEDDSLLIAPSV